MMPHCLSVTVDIDGRTQTICTIVPGNDALKREVESAEQAGQHPRAPTDAEVGRAVDYFRSFPEAMRPRPGTHQRQHR